MTRRISQTGEAGLVIVERPEHEDVRVDPKTLTDVAAQLATLRGLTAWGGNRNIGLPFGDNGAFPPAKGLGQVHDTAMAIAWAAVNEIETLNERYAAGLARAAEQYDAADQRSAEAVNAVADAMTTSPTDEQGNI